jgi:hypothetical protein
MILAWQVSKSLQFTADASFDIAADIRPELLPPRNAESQSTGGDLTLPDSNTTISTHPQSPSPPSQPPTLPACYRDADPDLDEDPLDSHVNISINSFLANQSQPLFRCLSTQLSFPDRRRVHHDLQDDPSQDHSPAATQPAPPDLEDGGDPDRYLNLPKSPPFPTPAQRQRATQTESTEASQEKEPQSSLDSLDSNVTHLTQTQHSEPSPFLAPTQPLFEPTLFLPLDQKPSLDSGQQPDSTLKIINEAPPPTHVSGTSSSTAQKPTSTSNSSMQWHSAKSPPFASPVVQWGKVPSSAIDDGKLSTWQRQKKAATVFIGSETPARKRTVSIGAQSQVQPSSLIQFGVSPPSANKKSSQEEEAEKQKGQEKSSESKAGSTSFFSSMRFKWGNLQ